MPTNPGTTVAPGRHGPIRYGDLRRLPEQLDAALGGAAPQRERGPEYVVVLVSEMFDGVPWLERVYQCGALWDAAEMGDHADVHCYTPLEFERKRDSLPLVRRVSDQGIDLLAA